MTKLYGGIEGGGTKFVCAVGTGPSDLEEIRFNTTTPAETIERCLIFFEHFRSKGTLKAIGIGSFGPVDLRKDSPTYGYITSTPKSGWAQTDLAGPIRRQLGIPVGFDTDVNAAVWGEFCWGAAQGLESSLYLTIGTGIGGGALSRGRLIHGLVHPEMGHIFLPQRENDRYAGRCVFHGNACFEGLASGPAIEERWDISGQKMGKEHEAWDLEAHYIALALVNFICTLSPERIILGGGVMSQIQLFPAIRRKTLELLNGYIQSSTLFQDIDSYIVGPKLGNRSGVLGALALAREVFDSVN